MTGGATADQPQNASKKGEALYASKIARVFCQEHLPSDAAQFCNNWYADSKSIMSKGSVTSSSEYAGQAVASEPKMQGASSAAQARGNAKAVDSNDEKDLTVGQAKITQQKKPSSGPGSKFQKKQRRI